MNGSNNRISFASSGPFILKTRPPCFEQRIMCTLVQLVGHQNSASSIVLTRYKFAHIPTRTPTLFLRMHNSQDQTRYLGISGV